MDVKFYSHNKPKIELKRHLKDVAERATRIYDRQRDFIKLPINKEFIYKVCISHDFGKYTSFFQNYINKAKEDDKNRHYHGFISALFGAWLVGKKQKADYLPLIAYFVIKHHHGDLKNFDDDLDDDKNSDNFLIVKDQISDLTKAQKFIEKEYGFEIGGFLKNYMDVWKALKKQKFELFEKDTKEKRIEVYFTILYVYSVLIDSDKKSAAEVSELGRVSLPDDLIKGYRKVRGWDKAKSDIDKLRNDLYHDVRSKVENLRKVPDISTITAPTGLGKTILNLEVALRYRNKLNYKSRIIYSLPFISIIDQTYKVFDEIFSKILGNEYDKNRSLYLLKHHHLANTIYKSENERKPINESLFYIESWDSEVVITTFIQLLYSVIAFKNSFIKKFHNITGSIIILDEVQTINTHLWKAIGSVLEKMTELLGCKIILSTATRPLIINNFTELVENQDKYFKAPALKRTILIPKIDKTETIGNFTKYFWDTFDENVGSYLVVFNTIRSSIEFCGKIEDILKQKGYKVYYLSTNIIPMQRIVRLRKIKSALDRNEKIVLVSTQVVEAGVDLDFRKAYRDLAPLDSIIQVAGRCNRNGKFGTGLVEVHKLINVNTDTEYSKMIYGSTQLSLTRRILEEFSKNEISEEHYKDLSNSYFRKLKENKASDKEVIEDIEQLRFYKSGGNCIATDFKVIEDLPFYMDIFVEINKTAKRIYERFEREVLSERDPYIRKENYQKLKVNFRKYIISVPQKFIKCFDDNETFPKIPLEDLDTFYDKNYGFKLSFENGEDYLIW